MTLREGTLHIVLLFYTTATVFLRFAEFRLTVHRINTTNDASFVNDTCNLVPLFLDQRIEHLRRVLPLMVSDLPTHARHTHTCVFSFFVFRFRSSVS